MACNVDPRRAAAEKAVEKHMGGCMAGFLHIFDRHHLLSSKRLHHSPSSPPAIPSPAAPSPAKVEEAPAKVEEERMPATKQVPSPALDEGLLRSSWKLRDSPRLSLDSRVGANLRRPVPAELARHSEAAEKGRRGPGVVARLMGLDALPSAPEKKTELRRSASESRVSGRRLLDLEQQEKISAPPETAAAKRKEPTPRCQQQRRSFFDVFPPEPAKKTIAIPTELEKKLKLKWVDDNSTDLEALKQVLEALQLKGLLHTTTASPAPEKKRNLVYDSTTPPSRSPRTPRARRPPAGDFSPPSSPHKCRRPTIISPNRKNSPATVSPRLRKSPARAPPPQADDESSTATTVSTVSTMSDSNGSAQSCSDGGESGRGSMAECYYKEGRSLLERCDKLLHSIAEMTGNEQPSPVSVLDAGPFHREEEEEDGSPPPIPMKRCLLFHETGVDGGTSPERFAGDGDFFYVGEILRAMEQCDGRRWSEVFAALERRMYAGGTKAARLHRRLLFDAVVEIAGRPSGWAPAATPKRVWTEVERLRRQAAPAGDVGEVVGGVLGKDMAAAGVWGCAREETAEAVLDVERLIFKDLVGEAIRDLAVAGEWPPAKVLRRRLPF